ncbi:MAG TPA: hydrogenase expression/formation protein HypE, partial [Anaerolineaceae bacterium]|nr:hydrogenase expression/formation protein HypE [Anaerolineaceae bacterium]
MDNNYPEFEGPACPMPLKNDKTIIMGHGSGGLLTHNLIKDIFQSHLTNSFLDAGNDFASIPIPQSHIEGRLSISTDGHIISPIFFPGGDIGRLAV